MHTCTARDMFKNTRHAAKSVYDGVDLKKQKLNGKNWRDRIVGWPARRFKKDSAKISEPEYPSK